MKNYPVKEFLYSVVCNKLSNIFAEYFVTSAFISSSMNTILFSVVILALTDNRFDFLIEHRIVSNLANINAGVNICSRFN